MGSNRTDSCWYEPAECFGGCIFSGRGGGISSGIGGGIISGLAGLGGGISSGIGGGIISGLDRTNRGINSELAGFGGGGINSGLAGASAGLGGTGINSGLLGAFTSPVASCAAMACSVKTAWRRATGSPASSARWSSAVRFNLFKVSCGDLRNADISSGSVANEARNSSIFI